MNDAHSQGHAAGHPPWLAVDVAHAHMPRYLHLCTHTNPKAELLHTSTLATSRMSKASATRWEQTRGPLRLEEMCGLHSQNHEL